MGSHPLELYYLNQIHSTFCCKIIQNEKMSHVTQLCPTETQSDSQYCKRSVLNVRAWNKRKMFVTKNLKKLSRLPSNHLALQILDRWRRLLNRRRRKISQKKKFRCFQVIFLTWFSMRMRSCLEWSRLSSDETSWNTPTNLELTLLRSLWYLDAADTFPVKSLLERFCLSPENVLIPTA